jgi:hypothetical protein
VQAPESLQTIAEISIALAGFSGLVVALRKRKNPLSAVEKYRMQVLLALAFGAMFLSFLPELLMNFGIDTTKLWPCSSSVVILYSGVFVYWWVSASRKIARVAPEIFSWYAFARMIAGHVIVVLLLVAVIAFPLDVSGAAAYVVALIWYLVHAAQQFTRMLFVQRSGSAS